MTYLEKLTERISELKKNPIDDCLEWWGTVAGRYGQITIKGKRYVSHRVAWELFYDKEFPKGLVAHHKCLNKLCYNPTHLEPTTNYDNLSMPDGTIGINLSKTHCPQGHEYSIKNTRVYMNRRHCRECDRLRSRRRYHDELAK